MLRMLALVVLAAGLTLTVSPAQAAPGGAVRLEPPTQHVSHVRIISVTPARAHRVRVGFNTGSLWSLKACRSEDSNNCYWDARKRGNGHGRSFATIHGRTYYR